MTDLSIKIAEPKINETDPWADDKLGRKACAEMLSSLLVSQTTALTVSVNGEWGSGKTFMLKRWQQKLSNDGYKAIYFNAWEDDFMGDPLVAIVGQLRMFLEEDPNFKGVLAGAGEAILNLASGMLKKATGMDVIAATSAAQEASASNRDNILDDYEKLCTSRTNLKNTLQTMANEVFVQTNKPLVFIVDELDRCRPTFAIETLERIKHLFDIDHVVFALGIDRKQLGESIKSVYGNIEIEKYLHRFIDLDFQLPHSNKDTFLTVLWDRHEIDQHVHNRLKVRDGETFKDVFSRLARKHNLSFREIEHAIRLFILLLRNTPDNSVCYPLLLITLIFLKLKNNVLYTRYINKECSFVEIMDYILYDLKENENTRGICYLAATIFASFMKQNPTGKMEQLQKTLINAIDKGEIIDHIKPIPMYITLLKEHQNKRFFVDAVYDCINESSPAAIKFTLQKIDLIATGLELGASS